MQASFPQRFPGDPKKFGPMGRIMFKELPHKIVEMEDFRPEKMKIDDVEGRPLLIEINPDYIDSPALPAFAEYHGTIYRQASYYAPFYNSGFFMHPKDCYKLVRAQNIEAYVSFVSFLCAGGIHTGNKDHPHMATILQNHKGSLVEYQHIKKAEPQERVKAVFALQVTENKSLMNAWFGETIAEMDRVFTCMDTQGLNAVREQTEYPDDLFSLKVTMADIGDYYQDREKSIDLNLFSPEEGNGFWKNICDLSEEQRKELRGWERRLNPYLPGQTG